MYNTGNKVPPGFRFHPTDEELVNYYLRKKVCSKIIDHDVIKDVELCKIEPWDLQDVCGIGKENQHEWYFFSHKVKKYLTGSRTNRATTSGFWKATGRDKPVYYKHKLVGMRKTLVFYKGRAPNGQKSDWNMHEYRLEEDECEASQEDGWVVCRVFKKGAVAMKEENQLDSPFISHHTMDHHYHHLPYSYKEQVFHGFLPYESHHLHLPQLDIHKLFNFSSSKAQELQASNVQNIDQTRDWRVLERFVASQLSQDHSSF